MGIGTIAEFVTMDPRAVRDLLTVTGARVQAELRGLSCLPLSLAVPTRQGIAVTRSFGRPIETWADLREAIAAFATRAAEKLRAEKLRAEELEAGHLSVFAHTNPHNGEPWHSARFAAEIEPTADTGALIGEAVRLLRAGFRSGFRYYKAGVMLTALVPARRQAVLFATRDREKSAKAMAALDAINARFGRGTLRPASTGIANVRRPWAMRQRNLSPRYTTNIEEILVAKTF